MRHRDGSLTPEDPTVPGVRYSRSALPLLADSHLTNRLRYVRLSKRKAFSFKNLFR
jgi:hypothetical protein